MNDEHDRAADVIFHGGSVITVNDAQPSADALAVRDGKIVAVGDADDVMHLRGPETNAVDLAGGALLPGVFEPHTHPLVVAQFEDRVDLSGFTHDSAADVMDALREAIDRAPAGEWVLARGYDLILQPELRPLSMAELDQLAPDNPVVVLTQQGHNAFANSKAVELSGIRDDTRDPIGGRIGRDAGGRITGEFIELSGVGLILRGAPQPSRGTFAAQLGRAFARYGEMGFTTLGCPLIPIVSDYLDIVQEQLERAPVRMRAYLQPWHLQNWSPAAGTPSAPGGSSAPEKFKVLGVKYWADGSPYVGNIGLREPYLNTETTQQRMQLGHDHLGDMNFAEDELLEMIEPFHKDGWQIAVHTQGDRSFDVVLNVFERLLGRWPRSDHRHRVEHCAMASEAHLEKMAELGLVPSFYINHVYYYGDVLRDELMGPERTERWMPAASAKAHGLRFSLHNDSPFGPLGSFLRPVQTAVARKTRAAGELIGGDQRIAIDDAIRAVTLDAAYGMFEEDERGSLEVGKAADLTLLSADPRTADPDRLSDIDIVATYLDGVDGSAAAGVR